jgi:hypothetical protein
MEHNKVEEIQNFLNINSNSLLKNFPHIPFDEKIYGCYELNGQIQYGFSPEFDKNIINVNLNILYCILFTSFYK